MASTNGSPEYGNFFGTTVPPLHHANTGRPQKNQSLQSFPATYRGSGVLLHVSSLPSAYGIGDLGPAAFAWVDLLHEAGQNWWHAFPLGPTGYSNSPHQALSSFAGNWLLISPDELVRDGLLDARDFQPLSLPQGCIDYERVVPFKQAILAEAWRNFRYGARSELRLRFEQFCRFQAHWLDDYALFCALKARYPSASYLTWPEELLRRFPWAIARVKRELAEEIQRSRFEQFLVFWQAAQLRQYSLSKGLRLIGDLPFFVPQESSDVWANPGLFLLDDQLWPSFVAGIPPASGYGHGQFGGNPVYNWHAIREGGYGWWLDRIRVPLTYMDTVLLRHFRGFAAAWHVPIGAPNTRSGTWVPGPGGDFFRVIQPQLPALALMAEDLGPLTPEVQTILDQYELPATRVLQFAFDGNPANRNLPEFYTHNLVAFTGTHDTSTTRGWFETLPHDDRRRVSGYLRLRSPHYVARTLMRLAWSSSAAVAIAPLQDVLNLGSEAAMTGSQANWRWRCTSEMLSHSAFHSLDDLTITCKRATGAPSPTEHLTAC